jgi:hypothetical protein
LATTEERLLLIKCYHQYQAKKFLLEEEGIQLTL